MSSGHAHSHAPAAIEPSKEKPLWVALALTSTFLVAEVIGGIVTGSLALISDAAHMFTDAAALAIALAAIRVGRRQADAKRTFGYHRFEILAAAFNALLLFGVAIYILFEAYQRFKSPPAIESTGMLVIATFGLVINLISMKLLAAGKDKSLNVKGAYLEVWSDLLGSLGVIVGAIVIRFTGWAWVDSAIAVLIGLWVLPRTWVLLRDSVNILLEGVPSGIDLAQVRDALAAMPRVDSVHDLHLWSLTSGKTSLSAHLVSARGNADEITRAGTAMLEEKFGLHHTTLQVEKVPCKIASGDHRF